MVNKKPVVNLQQSDEEVQGEFSEAELKRFSIRYENGYDIKSDERYNAWLRRYHPKEKLTGQVARKKPTRSQQLDKDAEVSQFVSKKSTSTITTRSGAQKESINDDGKKSAVKRLSKRKWTKENSMINDDSNHDLELCGAEFCIISEFQQEKVQWIKCNKCSCWLHKYCCGLLENANPKKFFCDRHF